MKYKVLLYIFFMMLSVFVINGINFNNFFRTGRKIEAQLFVMLLAMIMSYLLTNFVWDFIGL